MRTIRESGSLGASLVGATLIVAGFAVGCAESPGETGRVEGELIRAEAPAPATERADDTDRLRRLEARLLATEQRLEEAERRAATAEARSRAAVVGGPKGPTALVDETVEQRSEAEIKQAATGVDDGAAGPLPAPEAPAYDERTDPYKAEAFNVDPDPND